MTEAAKSQHWLQKISKATGWQQLSREWFYVNEYITI
jgi:hypothetical protein